MIAAIRNTCLAYILRWLGGLLSRRKVHSAAAWCYREALVLVPDQGIPVQFELAKSHWQMQELAPARQLLEQILAVNPQYPEALNLSGAIALSEGRTDAAEALFSEAMRLAPKWAAPCNNLGNVFLGRDDFVAAEQYYRRALANDPDYVESLCNLSLVLNRTGRYAIAEELCRKAVRLDPGFAGAVNNLGSILLNLGRIAEGIQCYYDALRIEPNLAEAQINLASFLDEPGRLVGLIEHFHQQLERNPTSYIALLRLAQAYRAMRAYDMVEDYARRAIEVKPNAAPDAYSILGELLMHMGRQDEAERCYLRALDCGAGVGTHSSFIFHLHYCSDYSSDDIALETREWAVKYAENLSRRQRRLSHALPDPTPRRLKIGYISKDFRRHSIVNFFEPVLAQHNKQRVAVYCYANLFKPDDATERLKKYVDVWHDVSMLRDEELVKRIQGDAIDILVDLSGHTSGHRLLALACKPAPIQVTYLGYPGATSGLKAMDYRIVDAITDPEGSATIYATETALRLPGCFLTYQPSTDAPPITATPGLQAGYITFGSFNNIAKVNRSVIAAWASILRSVPNSRLLLKAFFFTSERVRQRYVEYFEAHGISAARLIFYDWQSETRKHLDLYGQVDIALDPFPYNGTTTTCEALWMGVPVICLQGDCHAARVGSSLLYTLGLEELVAADVSDYISKAVDLASAPERLNVLRVGMRERMKNSRLLNHAAFVHNLEEAYSAIWRNYCERQPVSPTEITLPLADAAQICLPDSLEVISRYVLEEQGDWFEAEMGFVRKFLKPGMHVLDVGANYGVYALSAAAKVANHGAVWAFEPNPSVAALLRRSAAGNGFNHLTVLSRAVSDYCGDALFVEAANSELSHLLDTSQTGANAVNAERSISVPVATLDAGREEFAWGRIDFIKIDAEGQESMVVRGASQLLLADAPLVMAEFKHGREFNTDMEAAFHALGFSPYRLVRGLMLLMPFSVAEPRDAYLLNLFFCKRETAALLVEQGLLVDEWDMALLAPTYQQVLQLHQCALRQDQSGKARLTALRQALTGMELLVEAGATAVAAQLSLARLLFDYGYQDRARVIYVQVLQALRHGTDSVTDEPFLPPAGPFEHIAVGSGELERWLIAAVAEWLATYTAYSSYFSPADALHYLRIVRRTGYLREETDRRIALLLRR